MFSPRTNNVNMDAETQEIRQARQRASVKWLLSKAFNNRVPDNLKDPFYRDHENQERLKPQIIVELGNATLYCQTLSNLYSDPNYQSLNHWSILQTLSRKGVPVQETPEMPLTETVLIQTNPLRINAHLSVIESLMTLYVKEIASGDRIPNAIRRISGINYQAPAGQMYEQALLAWLSHACAALKKRISKEVEAGITDDNGVQLQSPDIPPVRDFQDLCDGICLALLISYYCPKSLSWTTVRINYLPAVEDSIHNILLVSNFSQKHLPYNVFHMTPEDITYMRGSMKLNLVVLLTDLFNLFEIHPAKCVCYPGMDSQVSCSPSGANYFTHNSNNMIPTSTPSALATEYPKVVETNNHNSEAFVVHKSRGITTLSSMHSQQHQQQHQQQQQQQEPLVPARLRQAKEKSNTDTKADERGDYNVPAGRPSNWEQNRRPSYAGRRSRRNSSSEDSQLTIENFGGSQDQLNTIGRYERERDRERERKLSSASIEPAIAVRSSLADARGTLQLGYDTDSGSEKQDRETEKYAMRRQASITNMASVASNSSTNAGSPVPQHHPAHKQHSIDKDYMGDQFSDYDPVQKYGNNSNAKAVAAWQQNNHNDPYDDIRSMENASKLSTIRMKLEEKQRRIEQEKRKIELAMLRQQDKLTQEDLDSCADTLKWETMSNESKRTPDIDPIDLDKYQQSIAIMNMNLQDIQHDIQRLATQQSQIHAQHLQAQQLIQAQQIANMLNQQQTYGSQQHLAENFPQRPMPHQQNFGSTPHLPQMFNQPPMNAYNSRPPSRDPYQQQQQQHQLPMHHQYISENGQYMSPQQQQQSPHAYMQPQSIYGGGNGDNIGPYANQSFGNSPFVPHHTTNHQMQQQYLNRTAPSNYDDYGIPSPHYNTHQPNSSQSNHFYLHEMSPQQPHQQQQTQRRTWAHSGYEQQQQPQHIQQQHPLVDVNAWQLQKKAVMNDGNNYARIKQGTPPSGTPNSQQEFILHQNGGGGEFQHLFQVHSSPQHTPRSTGGGVQRQQSMTNLRSDNRSPNAMSKASSAPAPQSPPDDMMAPQSICFIGDEEDVDELERNIVESIQSSHISSDYGLPLHKQLPLNSERGSSSEDYDNNDMLSNKLNITSGNLTYRIPSPSRPSLHANSFQNPRENKTTEKGFYISFDDDQPKRPKPPLRAKRSPKKESSLDKVDYQGNTKRESLSQLHNNTMEINENMNGISADSHKSQNHAYNNVNKNNHENNASATYNKYTDASPIQMRQMANVESANNSFGSPKPLERRNKDGMNNQQLQQQRESQSSPSHQFSPSATTRQQQEAKSKALIIGTDVSNLDPESVDEMERRKEKIMLLSLQRRQQQEEMKARKEIEASQKREREREKEEERARKKEEQMARRAAILEQHRLKKAQEEAEREGKTLDRADMKQSNQHSSAPRLRQQRFTRPRPKTIHVDDASVDISEASSISSRGKKGSSTNLTGYGQLSSNSMRRDYYRGSQDSLTVKEPLAERGRTISRISVAKGSSLNFRGRKSNSLMNLCDSGLGRATPPRRAPSPGMAGTSGRLMPSPSGPGSLPPGLISKRRGFDDGSSDISSHQVSMMEYSGPKLYKQPAAKSNRGIILNAVEYCVFPGAVNRDAKQKVLEKIARSEAKHFLVLFRDAGCQFRALYSYVPETDQVSKLYGTGPSQVDEVMFDKFFKYNSGGKCFSQVHTKHLTVTIDAFTIHNSLWQGKKVNLPSKKDMALVI